MATITVSLPKNIYEDIKKLRATKGYASMNELVKDALQRLLEEEDPNTITENGFPVWFEKEVLKSEAEPEENDGVWETEEDIKKHFRELRKRIRKRQQNGKSYLQRKV